jgi:hypothetical protein
MVMDNSEAMLARSQQTTACNTVHNLPERLGINDGKSKWSIALNWKSLYASYGVISPHRR